MSMLLLCHIITMSYYYYVILYYAILLYVIVLFVHVVISIESTCWVMLKENKTKHKKHNLNHNSPTNLQKITINNYYYYYYNFNFINLINGKSFQVE